MQSTKVEQHPTKPHGSGGATLSHSQALRDKKVSDLIINSRRRLVEVPYTASLADTMNALLANRISAVPVAAPPGHWIGAGGSMILESDKQTGAARKHYIGMVTMMDVVAQIAGGGEDLERQMHVPVSSIIGHCPESLSLWTLKICFQGKDRRLVGTFSATDLRVCPIPVLHSCCWGESTLGEVVDKVVDNHVHRVWVVEKSGCLAGVISLTDIIRATRLWML